MNWNWMLNVFLILDTNNSSYFTFMIDAATDHMMAHDDEQSWIVSKDCFSIKGSLSVLNHLI